MTYEHVFRDSVGELQEYLEYRHKLTSGIRFTLEVVDNERINLLDLSINRKKAITVYRIPTATHINIHCDSFHYNKHKSGGQDTLK